MAIIYFILILGMTVFIHELGHFMFAKLFKVYVYEFSIGMGPRLFKFKRKNDETDYCIRLFPIGGFVQMAGEGTTDDENIPKEQNLQSKTIFERFMIMVAGVMMNFLLAIVVLFFIGVFNPVSLNKVYVKDSIVGNIFDGDKIVAIDGNFVNNYDKLSLELTLASKKDKVKITLKDQNGSKKDIEVNPINVGKSGLIYGKSYGIEVNELKITKTDISEVNVGDKIVSVNGNSVKTYNALLAELLYDKDDSVTIEVSDENNNISSVVLSVSDTDDKVTGYSFGFYVTGKTEQGIIAGIKYAFLKFFSSIEQMIFTVYYLIVGKISLNMLSGPVGIYSAVSIYSKYGISNLFALLALICINVGFINILPLPAFDGGHVVFLIIEKIKGSKVSSKVENTIHNVGFILLMLLMIFVTFNDLVRLFK